MKKGFTNKPCPGCGEQHYRLAVEVCGSCRKLMDEAKAERERISQDKEYETYRHAVKYPSGNPYYFTGESIYSRGLQTAFANLILAIGLPAAGSTWVWPENFPLVLQRKYSDRDSAKPIRLQPAVREALSELDLVIASAIEAAAKYGYREGSSLLGALKDGRLGDVDYQARRAEHS